MPSLLFVCTANICRSPMAMAIFKSKITHDTANWRIESAGTWAVEGMPASINSQQVLADHQIDLSYHLSRPIDVIDLDKFDLILVMEHGHKEAIQMEYPEVAGRVYLLWEMVGEKKDVHDPYGGRLVDYADTAEEIDQILTKGMEKIKELAYKNERVKQKKK